MWNRKCSNVKPEVTSRECSKGADTPLLCKVRLSVGFRQWNDRQWFGRQSYCCCNKRLPSAMIPTSCSWQRREPFLFCCDVDVHRLTGYRTNLPNSEDAMQIFSCIANSSSRVRVNKQTGNRWRITWLLAPYIFYSARGSCKTSPKPTERGNDLDATITDQTSNSWCSRCAPHNHVLWHTAKCI